MEVEQPSVVSNPFAALENGFKAIYNRYKKERAEYNRKLEAEREENLKKKQAVIDDLKSLVEKQDDLGTAFPAFRELQARWRAIGQVPVQNFRNLNDTYQFYVEQFYDKVQINRDLRDLDFKKNLEAKEHSARKRRNFLKVKTSLTHSRNFRNFMSSGKNSVLLPRSSVSRSGTGSRLPPP